MLTHGRKVIYTDCPEITEKNVVEILNNAVSVHDMNAMEIEYLLNVYKGKQDILLREKTVRKDINNKIVVNRAAEIVDFKHSYLLGEPMQYVSTASSRSASRRIEKLNGFMRSEHKAAKDLRTAFWFTLCGVGYKMCLPKVEAYEDEAPFDMYSLDPRRTFVVYYKNIEDTPAMGVRFVEKNDGQRIFSIYTHDWYFEIENGLMKRKVPLAIGMIPIVEYPANESRMGAFESVLTLLNSINKLESNRVDGVEQFIQAFLVFRNCDIDSESFKKLQAEGALKVKSNTATPADVFYLNEELNQTQTQTLIDDLDDKIRSIVGMPAQSSGGNSTSDTGKAVILRDGWELAESRAKIAEGMFRASEDEFLKIVLKICRYHGSLNLSLSDVEQKFTRRNYADLLTKAQVLTTMLAEEKISPDDAYAASGMFTDVNAAYQRGMEWYEKNKDAKEEVVQI